MPPVQSYLSVCLSILRQCHNYVAQAVLKPTVLLLQLPEAIYPYHRAQAMEGFSIFSLHQDFAQMTGPLSQTQEDWVVLRICISNRYQECWFEEDPLRAPDIGVTGFQTWPCIRTNLKPWLQSGIEWQHSSTDSFSLLLFEFKGYNNTELEILFACMRLSFLFEKGVAILYTS